MGMKIKCYVFLLCLICKKQFMYYELFQFIGCIRNVPFGSFLNVQRNNALFEFFFCHAQSET